MERNTGGCSWRRWPLRRINLLYFANLLGYIAILGSVFSVILELNPFFIAVFCLAFLTGLFLDRRPGAVPLLHPLFIFGLVIFGIIFSLIGVNDKNIFNRALGILLLIISAKLIAPKKRRDTLQIYLLNFFMVTGSAVTRLDLEFGLFILGEAFITTFGLLLLYGASEQNEAPASQVWQLARWSGVITLCLIPATVIIFLLIPRPTMALFAWGKGVVSRTGFSDRVTPGAVEEIKEDNSPAFRAVWIRGSRPEKILWRGIVYDTYNQGAWEKKEHQEVAVPAGVSENGQYEVILEPMNSRYLPGVGLPRAVVATGLKTHIVSGYTIESNRVLDHRIIYKAGSFLSDSLPADSAPEVFLDVPFALRKALNSMTSGLRKNTDLKTARAAELFLKREFQYSLVPGKPSGNPVLYFLKTSRKGHCEYFATAMVFLLRSMGVPARIVAGYLGGEWNDMGRYYLVRQSDAHTWVEVWITGRGWVTFDPTPSVAIPGRTRGRLYRFIDMLRLKWYYWVVDYDLGRQLELVRKSSSVLKTIRYGNKLDMIKKIHLLKYLILFFVISGMLLSMGYMRRRYVCRPKTYGERLVSLFGKYGYHKEPGETPLEFVVKIASERPALKRNLITFLNAYYLFDYGQKGSEVILSGLFRDIQKDLKKQHGSPFQKWKTCL